MIYHDVLEAVGNTPLIRLNRMTDPEDAEVLVKFEAVNIGGSVKTRTALNMIQAAEKDGRIGPDTIIDGADKRQPGDRPCADRRGEGI